MIWYHIDLFNLYFWEIIPSKTNIIFLLFSSMYFIRLFVNFSHPIFLWATFLLTSLVSILFKRRTPCWINFLHQEQQKTYFNELDSIISQKYKLNKCTPSKDDIFKSLKLTSLDNLKIVIIGQDPYPSNGEADGLAFSSKLKKTPGSLKNIFKQIKCDLNIECKSNCLDAWAKQGVLLLNKILTNEVNKKVAHKNIGWEKFTNNLIKYIDENKRNIIFVLLGQCAQTNIKIIKNNFILKTSHPSPLSSYRGFNAYNLFTKLNQMINGKINWETF